jgi:hypothetical protein
MMAEIIAITMIDSNIIEPTLLEYQRNIRIGLTLLDISRISFYTNLAIVEI